MTILAYLVAIASGMTMTSEISAPGPIGALMGTITHASDRTATVVLIIPGSGPTDRDGNNPLGVKAATYRLLAEELATRGVTTIRTDKRGMFASTHATLDANSVTIDEYVTDTRSWIEAAKKETGAKCIWLLGHSEGGLIALAAAQRETDICGLVLVSAVGRPMGEVLKEQLRANPANVPLLRQADTIIDALAAGRRTRNEEIPPPLATLFPENVQGFLISSFSLDPSKLAKQTKVPMLIVQGLRDIQVSIADAQALHAANPSSQLALLADTNHVLKQVNSSDMGANLATYGDSERPLAPGVANTIAVFVKQNRPQPL